MSTGPPVNLPIAAAYAVAERPETLFFATAVTVAAYWTMLLAAVALLEPRQPALAVALLMPLLLLNPVALEQRLTTAAYGELPAVALVCMGIALLDRRRERDRIVGALLLGLAILTKSAIAVGLLPAVTAWAIVLVRRAVRRRAPVRWIRLAATTIAAVAPILLWQSLPSLVLADADWQRFADAARSRRGFEASLAFGDLAAGMSSLLRHGRPDDGTLASIRSRVDALAAFHGGAAVAWALVLAAASATARCLLGRRRGERAAGWIGLFGFATLLWWLLANRLGWYRHLLPADLAFAVVIVRAVTALTSPPFRAASTSTAAAVALYVAAAAGLVGMHTSVFDRHRAAVVGAAREKEAAIGLAALVRERLDDHAAFYGVGWYQAPQIQLLSSNVFRDVGVPADVVTGLAEGRTPFLVLTPEALAFERSAETEIPALRAAARRVLFDDADHQLLELDPEGLRRLVDGRRARSATE